MDTVTRFILLGVISGLTRGDGVLPDGPLTAAVGGTVMFTTTVTPPETPFVVVAWNTFNKTDYIYIITSTSSDTINPEYEGRITLDRSTGSLELRDLALNDSGEYSVSITPNGGFEMKGSTRLEILVPVSNIIANASSTDLVEFNSSVSLSCSSSGSSVSFLWLNGSSEVTAGERVHLTDGGSTLTINNVTRYDQGPFRCKVSNAVSEGTSDPVNLSISFGPHDISIKVSKTYFKKGSTISMSCSAVSRPSALFYWFLNGSLLSDTGPKLTLENVQMNQSGNYSCQAFNTKTLRYQTSQPSAIIVVENDCRCPTPCIVGIVIACVIVICGLVGGGYYIYKKKKQVKKTFDGNIPSRSGGEGQENTAHSEELNYVGVHFAQNKPGATVQLGLQNNTTEYAQIQVNKGGAAVSTPPTYDVHMQKTRRPAPQPGTNGAHAQVHKK